MGALPAHLPNTTDASWDTSYVSIPRLGLTLIGRFCLTNQNVWFVYDNGSISLIDETALLIFKLSVTK